MLRINEVLNLHLLKLAATEDEVARCNFITKCLALLSDTKRQIRIKSINDIFKISENTLSGFRAKVADTIFTLCSTNVSLEHHIKGTRAAQWITIRAYNSLLADRRVHLLHRHTIRINAVVFQNMICPVAPVINRVLAQRIDKGIDMPTGLPDLLVHQNCCVHAVHVVAFIDKVLPPQLHNIPLQRYTKRTVIPRAA